MHTKIDVSKVNIDKTAVLWIEGHPVLIDRSRLRYACLFEWHIKYSLNYKYAYRNMETKDPRQENKIWIKTVRVYMHRELAGCPKNMVVHHKNYCGLDNRVENLQVMTAQQNHDLHNRSSRPRRFPQGPHRALKKPETKTLGKPSKKNP